MSFNKKEKLKIPWKNILLVEQPSITFCKGTLASLVKKEESLKEACIDKNVVDYFSYVLRSHQVKVKLSIGIYKDNFLYEVVPKETCHVLLRQPLQRIKIFMKKVVSTRLPSHIKEKFFMKENSWAKLELIKL